MSAGSWKMRMSSFAASFVDFEAIVIGAKPGDYEPIVSFPHGMTDLMSSLLR